MRVQLYLCAVKHHLSISLILDYLEKLKDIYLLDYEMNRAQYIIVR